MNSIEDPIEATGRFTFSADKLDAIKRIVDECIDVVRQQDIGTLQYDWFFSEDHTKALVREKYIDADALLTHAANVATQMARLQALATVSIEIYGKPSAQLQLALRGMDIPVFKRYAAA